MELWIEPMTVILDEDKLIFPNFLSENALRDLEKFNFDMTDPTADTVETSEGLLSVYERYEYFKQNAAEQEKERRYREIWDGL